MDFAKLYSKDDAGDLEPAYWKRNSSDKEYDMISTYAVVKILAAFGTVAIFALFVGAYKLVQAALENRR